MELTYPLYFAGVSVLFFAEAGIFWLYYRHKQRKT